MQKYPRVNNHTEWKKPDFPPHPQRMHTVWFHSYKNLTKRKTNQLWKEISNTWVAGGKEWKGQNSRKKEEKVLRVTGLGMFTILTVEMYRCTHVSKCSKLHISNIWSSLYVTYNLTKARGQGCPGPWLPWAWLAGGAGILGSGGIHSPPRASASTTVPGKHPSRAR